MASLLGSLAKDLKLPEELGDPVRTIPIPCELVHQGCGKSCEKHAMSRFCRGWLFAAKMYGPLQLIVLLRNIKAKGRFTQSALIRAILDMARSSAFLGTFIAFFYYGVCLSRTRLGPKLFSYKTHVNILGTLGLSITDSHMEKQCRREPHLCGECDVSRSILISDSENIESLGTRQVGTMWVLLVVLF